MRQINLKNFLSVVPSWGFHSRDAADAVDDALCHLAKQRGRETLKGEEKTFWIELDGKAGTMRLAEPDGGPGDSNAGFLIIDAFSPMGGPCQVVMPLHAFIKGYSSLVGLHTVYAHEMQGPGKILRYVGITKQRWFDRLSQHISSANGGSHLVFHQAIRANGYALKIHRLIVSGCSYDAALKTEEDFVDEFSLYPMGLNMIPGGKAGLAYLARFGLRPTNALERDDALQKLSEVETLGGKPNPLCAARWATDQDFVNSIICGHGNRLAVDQVRDIRRLGEFGKTPDEIARALSIPLDRRIAEIVRGIRYSRVK